MAEVRFHPDVDSFWAAARSLYEHDPVKSTMELTLVRTDMTRFEDPVFLTVWEGDTLIGAALHTPPFPLACNALTAASVGPAVHALAARPVESVRGRRDVAEAFAWAWTSATGTTSRVTTEERLYRLGALTPPPSVAGDPRHATLDDLELVAAWVDEFMVTEFGDRSDRDRVAQNISGAMAIGNQYVLWETDRTPVSLAAVREPIARMTRIGPVFTPAERRGNGYGSAVTAAAASWGRAAGADEVVLFTDLANPVSNRIYQRIGFEPVIDWARIDFTP